MRGFRANINVPFIALVAAQAANGQFQFNPGTFDASELQLFLSAHYYSYASIWEDQLSQASASLPGAYSILTSIYNTDEIPPTYDREFVSHLAEEMVSIGHTTVVDPQVNSNTISFTPTASETSSSNEPTQSPSESQSSEDIFTLSTESDSTDTTSDGVSVYSKSIYGGLALSMILASTLAYF